MVEIKERYWRGNATWPFKQNVKTGSITSVPITPTILLGKDQYFPPMLLFTGTAKGGEMVEGQFTGIVSITLYYLLWFIEFDMSIFRVRFIMY